MKIKVAAEDFLVREESELDISSEPQSQMIFRLIKRDWETFDLLDLLARRLKIRKQDISVAGIKDRHCRAEQLVSIRYRQGLRASIDGLPPEDKFTLTFLGYVCAPITAKDIRGNHFRITIRDIGPRDLQSWLANAEIISRWGVPNYYDEQRFASARHGRGSNGWRLGRSGPVEEIYEPAKPEFAGPGEGALRTVRICRSWQLSPRCPGSFESSPVGERRPAQAPPQSSCFSRIPSPGAGRSSSPGSSSRDGSPRLHGSRRKRYSRPGYGSRFRDDRTHSWSTNHFSILELNPTNAFRGVRGIM